MLSSILIIYNTINHSVCNCRKIKILAAGSATPQPTSKCTHHTNLTILGDSRKNLDLWPWVQGHWTGHFYICTYGLNFKILRLLVLNLLHSQDIQITWPLTFTPGFKFILRFLVDASKVGYLKMLVHFLVQLSDSQIFLKTWPLTLRLRFSVAVLVIWISKSYVV